MDIFYSKKILVETCFGCSNFKSLCGGITSFIHSLFSWSTHFLSWNAQLSYLTYPILGPLNPVYALVIISPFMCKDYPNLKVETVGSSETRYLPTEL
jgi:hypothetical protein